ncbi:MAG: type IV secretion system DNA-binding domain-containing protein [Candidatus Saccharibacteria bacterium]|nr:type IV secretion system DNA-binding domain-containing protein [Candidatus Saccharibacteria bacterium]
MIQWLFQFFTQWYIWLPMVAILGYLTWRNYHSAKTAEDVYDYVLLTLEIPRDNDKKELSAEQLFASLHGILRDSQELKMSGGVQEHLSFEIASVGGQIRFYVRVPKHLQNFVEGQIYAQYPSVQIHEADHDYAASVSSHPVTAIDELVLTDNEFFPIKTFQTFDVDPLAGITAALTKLDGIDEEIWVQILVRPVADSWQQDSAKFIARYKEGFGSTVKSSAWIYLLQALQALWQPPEGGTVTKTKEMSERDKTRVSAAEKKSQKLGYKVRIRVAYLGSDQNSARIQMNAVASAFKQFNSTSLNGFKLAAKPSYNRDDLVDYTKRAYPTNSGFLLNIEELASVFHLPHMNVETPNVVWANSKTAEPPTNLPILSGDREHDRQISAFGLTNYRGLQKQFGIYRRDRSRHVYIIGQTGTGKSGLLELLALSDIYHNQGYAIIDPHGDFAIDNLRFIPESRIQDVVYFNPADSEYPLAFNPMEVTDPSQRNNISSEIIGVLKRMFGDSWGPRLEYILRYTILALLEYPDTTMLDITRMLTNKDFRNQVLAKVTDTVVLQFWRVEFASWNDKFIAEAVAPVLNKVGAFTANPIIRNIIGQPRSSFNIRQIMDEGKILIVNLSKGLIGEDNAAILGSFLVTKIQLAAMSRSDIPNVEDRRPFYLYVDEFQNFATDSFAVILSEARKYALNLTVANQYISQMSDNVRDAVFGNVGTMMSMRVSPEDAPILAQQFSPNFEAQDILQMSNRHFVCTMMIQGEKMPAFSGTTLRLPVATTDYLDQIIATSRAKYARPRAVVDQEIASAIAVPTQLMSKTARDKIKREEKAANASNSASNSNAQRNNAAKSKQISPSGLATPVKLGDLMRQIKAAAEGDDPNSMRIADHRSRSDTQSKQPEPKPVLKPEPSTKPASGQADTKIVPGQSMDAILAAATRIEKQQEHSVTISRNNNDNGNKDGGKSDKSRNRRRGRKNNNAANESNDNNQAATTRATQQPHEREIRLH